MVAIPPDAAALVREASDDLARRLNTHPDDIHVQDVESVTWPDASLGVPEPGMMYAQVLTPGWRITLQAGDAVYVYHTDQRRAVLAFPRS